MTDLDLRECEPVRVSLAQGVNGYARQVIRSGLVLIGLDWIGANGSKGSRRVQPPRRAKYGERTSPSRRRWSRDHRHRSPSYNDGTSCSLATLGRRPSSIEYKMALSQLDAALNRTARRFRNPHCRRQWSLVSRRILSGRASADAAGQFLHTKEETPTSHFDWHCVHRKKNERRTMERTRD